jgi:hypothetical protein
MAWAKGIIPFAHIRFVGLKLCDFKARFKTALKVLTREGNEHGRGHGHGHRQLTVAPISWSYRVSNT